MEMILIQKTESNLYEQAACILLKDKGLTKEERLLSILLAEVDENGVVKVIRASKEKLCYELGISEGTFKVYVSKWRANGIVTTSGEYYTFKKFLGKDTKYIAIY